MPIVSFFLHFFCLNRENIFFAISVQLFLYIAIRPAESNEKFVLEFIIPKIATLSNITSSMFHEFVWIGTYISAIHFYRQSLSTYNESQFFFLFGMWDTNTSIEMHIRKKNACG